MRLLIISTILALTVSGCAVKELDKTPGQDACPDIKVYMPSEIETRLGLGEEAGGKIAQVWQKGDRIAIVEAKGTSAQKTSIYELHGNGGTSEGLFCYVSGDAYTEGPVDIIYPVSAVSSNGVVPLFQTYHEGTYDPSSVVLSWHGDSGIPEEGVTLDNDMAVVCLQYTGEESQKVSSVKIKLIISETDIREYHLAAYDGIALGTTPEQFFISVPEVAQKCSVEFRTILTDHTVMTKTSQDKTFIAGDFYRFPSIDFVADPSGTSSYEDNLRAHPRLLMPAGHEKKIKAILEGSNADFLKSIHEKIQQYSDQLLNKDPYLRTSLSNVNYPREIMGRVMYLSYMYRMTGEEKYAQRAELELLAAAGHYEDWRPSHFLTTSEMTLAFAIGYDWLYDYLSESSKNIIVNEIITKGLDLADTKYGKKYKSDVGNWNSVCSACMTAAALAIFEHNPQKYSQFVSESIQNNVKAVENFSPDGGYSEGYSYWHYGTSYQTIMFEVLMTALGYKSTLPDTVEGFEKTGSYQNMLSTPTRGCFSYGDVAMDSRVSCATFWLARHFNHPEWLYVDRNKIIDGDFEQEDMLWRFNPVIMNYIVGLDLSSIVKPSQHIWFSRGDQPLFAYRSGFDSFDDVYLGIKGGHAELSHAHMDSGSFYYERDGVVWSDDLGSDSYTVDGYWSGSQNGARWKLFRLGATGHSTLSFDGSNHIVTATAEITDYFSTDRIGATVNLTTTFADKVTKAERTIYLENDILNIIDEVVPSVNTTVSWNMITPATAEITDDSKLMLSCAGKQMLLEIVSPSNAQLYVLPAEGGEGNLPNPDHVRVGFTAELSAEQQYELNVRLIPIK